MNQNAILLPVFVQVALTFALLIRLGSARFAAVGRGEVEVGDIALGQKAWPAHITQLANSYENQFELPVLFYALVGFALALEKVDAVLSAGAWAFVATRVLHALIHVTSNAIRQRFYAFLAGVIVLAAMWMWFAVVVLGAGGA